MGRTLRTRREIVIMSTVEHIQRRLQESADVKIRLIENPVVLSQIQMLTEACIESLRSGGQIILAGNGGSFSDAQHISTEFTSRFMFDRPPLASVTLGTNGSAISAMGNDYGYNLVFSRELEAIGSDKDIFIPISTSGNSPNILESIDKANSLGIKVVGLTGSNGGQMTSKCDCICVPSTETPRIQESHIAIGHIVSELVEAAMFPEYNNAS